MDLLTVWASLRLRILILVAISSCVFAHRAFAQEAAWPAKTFYRYRVVKGHRIFYREAGSLEDPTILLLHGYPSSSHTYRELIPLLSGRYHLIAPDYLGSGYSERPDPNVAAYTFDLLADHVEGLIDGLGIQRYVMYMQDFGAPVGYRLMMRHPKRVTSTRHPECECLHGRPHRAAKNVLQASA